MFLLHVSFSSQLNYCEGAPLNSTTPPHFIHNPSTTHPQTDHFETLAQRRKVSEAPASAHRPAEARPIPPFSHAPAPACARALACALVIASATDCLRPPRLSAMSDNVQRTLVSEVLVKMAQKRLILRRFWAHL
jgi:hypothetical protein